MPENPASLSQKLTAEGQKLHAYFAQLSEAQWQTIIYGEEGHWTVRAILAHLISAERAFIKLFENVRQGGPGAAEDFDIDRYNASQRVKMETTSPAELLTHFQTVRAEMADWVAALEPADLQKRGRHAAMGLTTLEEMIKMIYLHNQMHLRDIKKALR